MTSTKRVLVDVEVVIGIKKMPESHKIQEKIIPSYFLTLFP